MHKLLEHMAVDRRTSNDHLRNARCKPALVLGYRVREGEDLDRPVVEQSRDERHCAFSFLIQLALIRKHLWELKQLFGCDSTLSERKAFPEFERITNDDSLNDFERYQVKSNNAIVSIAGELHVKDGLAFVSESTIVTSPTQVQTLPKDAPEWGSRGDVIGRGLPIRCE